MHYYHQVLLIKSSPNPYPFFPLLLLLMPVTSSSGLATALYFLFLALSSPSVMYPWFSRENDLKQQLTHACQTSLAPIQGIQLLGTQLYTTFHLWATPAGITLPRVSFLRLQLGPSRKAARCSGPGHRLITHSLLWVLTLLFTWTSYL